MDSKILDIAIEKIEAMCEKDSLSNSKVKDGDN